MENENLDFDVKPTGNKDLWLFLIIIDIVALCVCGFFLYKHFAPQVFAWARPAAIEQEEQPAAQTPVAQPVEETVTVSQTTVEVEAPAPVTVTPKEVSMEAVLEKETAEAAAVQPLTSEIQPVEEKKQSVIVEINPKSANYRKVTFRWFGEGNDVAIVSGFTNRKPQALRKVGDYWETTLAIAPGSYKFLYIIDGENKQDPYSPEKDGRSVVEVK